MPRRPSNHSAAGVIVLRSEFRPGSLPGLFRRSVSQSEKTGEGVATNQTALRCLGMRHLLQKLRTCFGHIRPKTLADEQKAIPVVTVSAYRGDLALKHDRAQHRRYTAHFEDLQN